MKRYVYWLAALIVLASITPVLAQDKEIQKELDTLKKEVQDLREWKSQVEKEDTRIQLDPGVLSEPDDRRDRIFSGMDATVQLPGSLSLSVSGEHRTRAEYRRRPYSSFNPDGLRSMDYIHMRNRLRFDLNVEEDVDAVFELQDVRTWGEESSTLADTAGMDLRRGEMIVRNIFDNPLTMEVGRFTMEYGDSRIIGENDWDDTGRTFDGIRFQYDPDGFWVDAFGVRVRDDSIGFVDVRDAYGFYGGTDALGSDVDLEGYAIYVRDQMRTLGEVAGTSGTTQFWTFGARVDGETEGIDFSGEFAYQTGDIGDDDLDAYAFAADGGYTLEDMDWTPRVGGGLAMATGDDNPLDGDHDGFQTLFPENHWHYGLADLLGWSNMMDVYVQASAAPCDGVTFLVAYHQLQLDDEQGGWIDANGSVIRSGSALADDDLGEEIDVYVTWEATEALDVVAGWSHFNAGDFVRDTSPTGSKGDQNWFYLQAGLRF